MTVRVDSPLLHDPLIGRTVLGRFEVLRPLARGGMGVVYLARTLGAKGFVRPVVVKRLGMDTTKETLRMFVREAQVMANLSHPNIVQAIDFNREGSQYLLVLEYVEGYSLGRWAKFLRASGRDFPVQYAVTVTLDVLEALAYAHGLVSPDGSPGAIIHRDVTPSNVMVSTDGHVKLLDFGIARLEHEQSAEGPDGRTIKGKFAFLAPEVLAGEPHTGNSDVYSAAVMFHELLVGKNEFAAEDLSSTLANVVKHRPSRLDRVRPDVSKAIADVLEHALEKTPALRFANAQEFAAALRAARGADPQQVREAMVAQVRQDFFDPRLVETMGGFDLQTLASTWKTEPTPRPSITPSDVPPTPEPVGDQRPTMPEVKTRSRRPPPDELDATKETRIGSAPTESSEQKKNSTPGAPDVSVPREESRGGSLAIAAWAAAVAAVAALGAAGFVLYRSMNNSAQQGFVVVEANGASDRSATDAQRANSAAEDSAASAPSQGAVTHDASAHHASAPRDEASRLTAQFATHRAQIEACVRHADAGFVAEALRVAIDPEGAVTSAALVPESAATSPAGACVLALVRGLRFDRTERGMSVRFPLEVRAR